MRQIILIVGSPLGDRDRHDGRYVMSYDPHYRAHGLIETTDDISKALVFEGIEQAFESWRAVNRNRPLRSDGKPNRPLTAFTVEFVNVP